MIVISAAGQRVGRGYVQHFAAQDANPIVAEIHVDNGTAVAAAGGDKFL